MVEISNARYTELILNEQKLEIISKARRTMPSYVADDVMKLIFDEREGEAKNNAE